MDTRRLLRAITLCVLMPALRPAGTPAQATVEPEAGMLLVASPLISDVRFKESVLLLIHVGPAGAAGVIVNKPTATTVASRFSVVKGSECGKDPLYFGGPLGGHGLLMLRRADRAPAGWSSIADGVLITKDRMAMLDALMTTSMAGDVRVYAGYAGWAAGQLEREIVQGGWRVLASDADAVFSRDAATIWYELSRNGR